MNDIDPSQRTLDGHGNYVDAWRHVFDPPHHSDSSGNEIEDLFARWFKSHGQ
jgi:hypothetical protein